MKSHSNTLKAAVIGALALILLIPAALVQEVVDERSALAEEVQTELGEQWGRPQTVVGPYLVVPYRYSASETSSSGRSSKTIRTGYLHILPEKLTVNGQIEPEVRRRGIFDAVVYATHLSMSARFRKPNLNELGIDPSSVSWSLATLNLGISDARGLKGTSSVRWNGTKISLASGLASDNLAEQGVRAPVNVDGNLNVEVDLDLLGNGGFWVAPTGSTTDVTMTSPWTSPSFSGAFLPDKHDLTSEGFHATWTVNHLNRSYGEVLQEGDFQDLVRQSALGVDLIQPVGHYQKAHRAGRYAILFIGLSFVTFFLMEVLNRLRIHPIQYALVGIALVLFYSLLLSISEHVGFNWAYVAAATATVSLVTAYSATVLKARKLSAGVGTLLTVLYVFLFVVIQLEDYALLVGSLGLFAVVAAVMYFSRNVNWYDNPSPGEQTN